MSEDRDLTDPAAAPLNGLVLAGGHSRRMGRDKATIDYHGVAQLEWCVELLGPLVDRVYVSLRADQGYDTSTAPPIHDCFGEIGPMGGVLSAFATCPDVAWLVIAVDMPRLTAPLLRRLIAARDPTADATAFVLAQRPPEPMCAIYEPAIGSLLASRHRAGDHSLRRALRDSLVRRVRTDRPDLLEDVDQPETNWPP